MTSPFKHIENIRLEPGKLEKKHIGFDVDVHIDRPDTKRGKLVDFDDEYIYVKIGKGKPKKFSYEKSVFSLIQHDLGLILDLPTEEEKKEQEERESRNRIIREERMKRLFELQNGPRTKKVKKRTIKKKSPVKTEVKEESERKPVVNPKPEVKKTRKKKIFEFKREQS